MKPGRPWSRSSTSVLSPGCGVFARTCYIGILCSWTRKRQWPGSGEPRSKPTLHCFRANSLKSSLSYSLTAYPFEWTQKVIQVSHPLETGYCFRLWTCTNKQKEGGLRWQRRGLGTEAEKREELRWTSEGWSRWVGWCWSSSRLERTHSFRWTHLIQTETE